ncbi:hypothetical protein O6H91_01G089700 [Diphasiastrum complanatum]|uniref:Uncharacterized protein n=1 Tax=Diphasiastrum complanatum TaxID=34168 RepID=A0ACC2ET69_DIPCM|nr:hypothetical protein O6H91_01G089700 [Diphasiastrum complanatum]
MGHKSRDRFGKRSGAVAASDDFPAVAEESTSIAAMAVVERVLSTSTSVAVMAADFLAATMGSTFALAMEVAASVETRSTVMEVERDGEWGELPPPHRQANSRRGPERERKKKKKKKKHNFGYLREMHTSLLRSCIVMAFENPIVEDGKSKT